MKKDSNPYQTWFRVKLKSTAAFRDMSLLARKLPKDKQEEIFNDSTIIPLINYIVNSMVIEPSDESDYRRTKIAAMLARIAIMKCIRQYEKIVPNEVLREPMVNKLRECISYCNQIAIEIGNESSKGLKMRVPINSEGEHKRSHYFSRPG